jgi:hypothetical protein
MAQLHTVRTQSTEMDDLNRLKKLAGVVPASFSGMNPYNVDNNMTATAQEKADHQKANDIKPGDPDWFKLWFARPYLTGENPF